MNGERRYFLDTNALVALGNGHDGLRQMLEEADYIATSVICKIEYLQGVVDNPTDYASFVSLLNVIDVVDLTHGDIMLTNEVLNIRQVNKHIKLPDAIVMASAISRQAVLITNDRQLLNAGFVESKGFE